jgi:hypothetical protein
MNKPTHAGLGQLPTCALFIQIDHLRTVCTLGLAKVNRQANIFSIPLRLHFSATELLSGQPSLSESSALFPPARTDNQASFLFVRAGRICRVRRHPRVTNFVKSDSARREACPRHSTRRIGRS